MHENVFILFRGLFICGFMYNYNHYVSQEWGI
jgi:hypothetical protein